MNAITLSQFQLQRLERFVVREKRDRTFLREKTVPGADAGMFQKPRAHPDVPDRKLHLFQLPHLDCARKIFPTDGKERQFHLGGENCGEAFARALIAQDLDRVFGLVSWKEKRQALDVVPVRVGEEQMQVDRGVAEFLVQRETELADAGAGIENDA